VRHAAHLDDRAGKVQAVEHVGRVGLHETLVILQDCCRTIAHLRRRVEVDGVRMIPISHHRPQPARLGLVVAFFLHRQARFVDLDDARQQHVGEHRRIERMQQVGARRHPVAQR
jgi:hypothetical protein